MKRYLCFFIMVGLLLVLAAPVAAQEAPTPEPVGLRPDAPTYALHGPHWVGTREFVIEPDSERPLPLTVWYPALNETGAVEAINYDMGISDLLPSDQIPILDGHALLDAAPAMSDAPYPLVVMSHGLTSSRLLYFRLAEHLASYGFVVAAVEHVGTAIRDGFQGTADVGDPNDLQSLYYRPADIMHVITYADTLTATNGALAGLINTDRVGVWGHSTGGTTVLQAGGARIDFPALDEWCKDKGEDEFAAESCQFVGHEEELAQLYGVADPQAGLFPALWDSRVDAVVAVSPGGELHAFGDAGIAAVQVPTMTMYGTSDPLASPEYNALWAYPQISSPNKALVAFENGGHLMFTDCPIVWCGYDAVWDLTRVDDLENHLTTAFLLDTLKGDKDAAAALVPDAVSFPGIQYQAQGF